MVTKKTTNNVTVLFLTFSDAAESYGHVAVPASKTVGYDQNIGYVLIHVHIHI